MMPLSQEFNYLYSGNSVQETWILDGYMQWTDGPMMRSPRSGHCMVQIDDCRVAVIGGSNQNDPATFTFIDVYDFEDHSWHEGPRY